MIRADWRVNLRRFILYFVLVAFLPLTRGTIDAGEKLTIGAVEDVILLPWNVRLPARIDTGARRSSLDARDLMVHDNEVVFTLPDQYGGLELRLPIIDWRVFRSSLGRQRRPVVEMELCLGSKRFRTQVALADRSRVQYPFLVGRLALRGHFLVDVSRSKVLPPSCSEGSS
ncbi:MAG: ATP-dependent zinc protease [Candidatus Methylomirabilales bacterium]